MYVADDCLVISTIAGKWTAAGNEEFCGRRFSHLEQFTNRSEICNSLPLDVHSMYEGPLVWLTASASEDYL